MVTDFPALLKKASNGDADAMQLLLQFFANKTLSAEEQEQVHLYLKKIATPHAIYLRALCYVHGYGVKEDAAMAFLLMRDAAAKGHAQATYQVGHYYLEGVGVEKNYAAALQWLERAADSPYYVREAMRDLGRMYEQGLGVSVDVGRAESWYEKAGK